MYVPVYTKLMNRMIGKVPFFNLIILTDCSNIIQVSNYKLYYHPYNFIDNTLSHNYELNYECGISVIQGIKLIILICFSSSYITKQNVLEYFFCAVKRYKPEKNPFIHVNKQYIWKYSQ